MTPIATQLNALLAGNIYVLMLVFARVGSALMLMPGFSANYMPVKIRLFVALGVSLAIMPVVRDAIPAEPAQAADLFILMAGEMIIGMFLGTLSLILVSAFETGGMIIAQQMGLSNAYIFNPQASTQGSLPGTLLGITAVLVLFVTDLHHMLLTAVLESYHVFRISDLASFGDMSDSVAKLVAESFLLAVQMAAPFMLVSFLMFIAFGLIARLMPQIQIFFITLPLQVGMGLIVFAMVAPVLMRYWLAAYQSAFSSLGLVQ